MNINEPPSLLRNELPVNDRRLHSGLGAATSADLTIRWPTGATETLPNVACNQLVTIREGARILRSPQPGDAAYGRPRHPSSAVQ